MERFLFFGDIFSSRVAAHVAAECLANSFSPCSPLSDVKTSSSPCFVLLFFLPSPSISLNFDLLVFLAFFAFLGLSEVSPARGAISGSESEMIRLRFFFCFFFDTTSVSPGCSSGSGSGSGSASYVCSPSSGQVLSAAAGTSTSVS